MSRYIYIFKHTLSSFQYTLKLIHIDQNIQINLNILITAILKWNVQFGCGQHSPKAGHRSVSMRQMEDYMRGARLESRKTQPFFFFPTSALAAALSLPLSQQSAALCANQDMKHHLSLFVKNNRLNN